MKVRRPTRKAVPYYRSPCRICQVVEVEIGIEQERE